MSLDEARRKLLALDPLALPSACRELLLVKPAYAIPLDHGLRATSWQGLPEIAGIDLFPKLGLATPCRKAIRRARHTRRKAFAASMAGSQRVCAFAPVSSRACRARNVC